MTNGQPEEERPLPPSAVPEAGGEELHPDTESIRGLSAYRRRHRGPGEPDAEPTPPLADLGSGMPEPDDPGRVAWQMPPLPARTPSREKRSLEETPPTPIPREHPRRVDRRATWGLFFGGIVLVLATYGDLGWSWDEAYYRPAAVLAGDWLALALTGGFPDGARSPAVLDRYWGGPHVAGMEEPINELPALCKWMWAASLAVFGRPFGTPAAMRFPSAVLFGAILALIYRFARRSCPVAAALLAALSYAAMPRVFGDAHFGATEMPMAFMALATTVVFARGVESARWAVAAGVVFGLALATKINAFFLFPALFLWAFVYHRARLSNPLAAMMFIGPLFFVALWPWLWRDTPARVLEYLQFHAGHAKTAVYYLGQKWGFDRPPAPWNYPFVLLALTTPPAILALCILGIARAVRRLREPFAGLILLQAALPIAIVAIPGQPKYDGVRLFAPAFPFLALLCGYGVAGLLRHFDPAEAATPRELSPNQEAVLTRTRRVIANGSLGLVVISGIWAFASIHPLYLSYFNRFAGPDGGLHGAWDLGMEVTYWGERLNGEVLDWLNDTANVPVGSSIKTRALFERMLQDHQKWGELRSDLFIDVLPPPSPGGLEKTAFDFHLVLARRGFWSDLDWRMFASIHRARKVFMHRGVPMVIVYGPLSDFE